MKKIKEIWKKNKVLIVLGIVLIICLIAILVVTFSYFFGGSKSVYGDRLDGIEDYEVTSAFQSEYISVLEDDESIDSVSIDIKGRVIYITINFTGDITLVEAESKAGGSLSQFSEDILGYYDINFILTREDTEASEGFTILGARNAVGTGVAWNNNTEVESDEE